jgi:nitroreductase
LLAATGLGLGAVWIGVHPIGPFVLHVSRSVGLPKHVTPLGVIYVGHPAESKDPRTQYDPTRVHWQTYQSKGADTTDLSNKVELEESNSPYGR